MQSVILRQLGSRPYEPVWHAMKAFTESRSPDTVDEFWVLEHEPVFTQGQAGKAEHLLAPGDIPVVPVDRGGQVTYHGPGQMMVYTLIDIARLGLGVRDLVDRLEQALVNTLAELAVEAHPRRDAPGVYVGGEKIASLGLRIRRGRSYHGLAFNLDMDLSPFQRINPCGFAGMPVTDLKRLRPEADLTAVRQRLLNQLCRGFGYSQMDEQPPQLPATAPTH